MTRPSLAGISSLALLVALAAALAACGSNSPRSADGGATQARLQQDAVRFAGCMRSHGVPNLPDPTSPREFKSSLSAISRSPAFRSAQAACRHLLPSHPGEPAQLQQTATRLADGLSFARCMRNHGVLRFPDPTPQGELSVQMVRSHGIDVRSPATLRAVRTCLPASHGALTTAKVRAALKQAGG